MNAEKKIWFYQCILLYILSLKDNNEIDIASYIDVKTLKKLLEEKEPNKLRLTSLTEANDIEEGNVLLKILEEKCTNITCSKENIDYKFVPVQRSFTRNKDSLTMFRLYGKNEDKEEATGACLVFENSFFDIDDDFMLSNVVRPFDLDTDSIDIIDDGTISDVIASTLNSNTLDNGIKPEVSDIFDFNISNIMKTPKKEKIPLYYVLYYDKETKELIYNPNKSKYDNIVISLKKNNVKSWIKSFNDIDKETHPHLKNVMNILENATTKENKEDYEYIVDYIKKEITINNIQFIFKKIFDSINEIAKDNFDAYTLLINLHYLIKDAAFVEESELRLLKIMLYGNPSLKNTPIGTRAYKEYLPIKDKSHCYIKEVILGNKVKNVYTLAESLNIFFKKNKYNDKITASVSKLPLR